MGKDDGGLHCVDVFRRSLLRRDGHIIVLQIIEVTKATVNTLCYRTQRGWNQVQEKEDRSLLGQKIQEWNSPYSSALDP